MLRHGLAGDQAGVELAAGRAHRTVRADALARRDQDLLPGLELLGPYAARAAVGQQEADRGGVEGQQPLGRGARAAPSTLVEVTADQQEEQERDGAVEIGVLAATDGLDQA